MYCILLQHIQIYFNKIFNLQDNRCLPGAGATEIELAKRITTYGEVWNDNISLFNVIFSVINE